MTERFSPSATSWAGAHTVSSSMSLQVNVAQAEPQPALPQPFVSWQVRWLRNKPITFASTVSFAACTFSGSRKTTFSS